MARNAEKAMTALARFRQAQLEGGKVKERRPFLASECNDLPKAEKWRRQIISEVAKKVAQIQNAGLGEFKIRDLNDEINKLLREKRHWEYRIRELGGSDYKRFGPRMLDHEGRAVPGNRGYKYFGAARDLPGVRELFEKERVCGRVRVCLRAYVCAHVLGVVCVSRVRPAAPELRKTRGELMKDVDAEYYGYRDEDDGVLVPMEILHKKRAMAEAIHKWRADCQCLPSGDNKVPEDNEDYEPSIYCVNNRQPEDDEHDQETLEEGEGGVAFFAHVPVPSQKEVEEALVRRKKMELLQRYASETLQQQNQEARTLLGL
ncbi:pre-mRNA-splicing factor ISY1 homolog isoform X1 [Syngnathus typhle]|uniref:pre-mRNA-splicing factor ISY1 homolog isoform X1 n=1 Tax=Syngnathus typhle TaxID=161592 RepID=UPI002A6B266E|nr:pre-mRNA-splicing factor ISY1 homolog isoform X1 [Syngnathus typhle]